jgi:hypothetical protein
VLRLIRSRWRQGYEFVEGGVCAREESMVGGGSWRYRVWSEGGWPCFGSGCRGRGEVLSRKS